MGRNFTVPRGTFVAISGELKRTVIVTSEMEETTMAGGTATIEKKRLFTTTLNEVVERLSKGHYKIPALGPMEFTSAYPNAD
jgi:hypothetical protein